jgi:hypothetical protein
MIQRHRHARIHHKTPDLVKDYGELSDWMTYHYPKCGFDMDKADFALAKRTIMRFHQLAQEYPEVGQSFRSIYSHDFVAGDSNFWGREYSEERSDGIPTHVLELNNHWFSNPLELDNAVAACGNNGWHPTGCDTIESVITHEFGHAVRDRYIYDTTDTAFLPVVRASGFGLMPDLINTFEKDNIDYLDPAYLYPSQYAKSNRNELFAESFASLYHTPAIKQLPYVKNVGKLLDVIKTSARYTKTNWHWFEPGSWEQNKAIYEPIMAKLRGAGIKVDKL